MSSSEDSSSFCSLRGSELCRTSEVGKARQAAAKYSSEPMTITSFFKNSLDKMKKVKGTHGVRKEYLCIPTEGESCSSDLSVFQVHNNKDLLNDNPSGNNNESLGGLDVKDCLNGSCVLKPNESADGDSTSSIKFAVDDVISEKSNLSHSESFFFGRDSCHVESSTVGSSYPLLPDSSCDAKNFQKKLTQSFRNLKSENKHLDSNACGNTKEVNGNQGNLAECSKRMTQALQCKALGDENFKSADYCLNSNSYDKQKKQLKGQFALPHNMKSLPQNSPRGSLAFSKVASIVTKKNSWRGKSDSSCSARSHGSLTSTPVGNRKPRSGVPSTRSYNSDCTLGRDKKLGTLSNKLSTPHSYSGRSVTPRTGSTSVVSLRLQCGTPVKNRPILSPALKLYKQFCLLDISGHERREQKETVLELLEHEMGALRTELREHDAAMEVKMLQSPFERLYHMNNRRNRDERRSRVLQYMKLAEAREHLMNENEEDEENRRIWRKELAEQHEEVFDRLYNTVPRRSNNSNTISEDSTRNKSTVTNDAFFERLYKEAFAILAARRERARRAEMTREQKEIEDALRRRILAKMELKASPCRILTPREKEERARSLQRKLISDPQRLQEYLETNRLSRVEEEMLVSRLSKGGPTNRELLDKKKMEKELEGCTFYPRTNTKSTTKRSLSSRNYTRQTLLSATRQKKSDTQSFLGPASSQKGSSIQKKACEKLYMKAVSQRNQAKLQAAEVDRQKRLALLRSRLKEDHHFRRRVELNPSLAERYMASLVV